MSNDVDDPARGYIAPWLRLYHEIADDPKLCRLTEIQRWRFVGALILNHRKAAPSDDAAAAFIMRITEREARETRKVFMALGLVDAHWVSPSYARRQFLGTDHSTIRTRRHREKYKNAGSPAAGSNGGGNVSRNVQGNVLGNVPLNVPENVGNVTVTPPETEERRLDTDFPERARARRPENVNSKVNGKSKIDGAGQPRSKRKLEGQKRVAAGEDPKAVAGDLALTVAELRAARAP